MRAARAAAAVSAGIVYAAEQQSSSRADPGGAAAGHINIKSDRQSFDIAVLNIEGYGPHGSTVDQTEAKDPAKLAWRVIATAP